MLRSNLWLTIHVLTEVSSYAAFALAWMLGLIATTYYLTATYRRSPRFRELALPLLVGLPMLAVGGAGVAASYGLFGPQWSISDVAGSSSSQALIGGDSLFYAFAAMALLGETLALTGSGTALGGEFLNRMTFRPEAQLETANSGTLRVKLRPAGPGHAADHLGIAEAARQLRLPRDAGRRAADRRRDRFLGGVWGPIIPGADSGAGTRRRSGR